MKSRDVSCRIGLLIGGVAIVGMTAMTAGCGKGEDKCRKRLSKLPGALRVYPPPSGREASE